MKRILSLVLLLTLLCTLFACGKKNPDQTPDTGDNTNTNVTYKLGLGTVVENSADDVSTEVTVATVLLGTDGKIVACRIDTIAVEGFAEDGVIDTTKTFQSKMELGSEYGMLGHPYGSTLAEWDAQAKAFETYVVGKSVSDVEGITTDSNGKTDLIAGCTVAVASFIEAVAKACKDTYAVSFEAASVPTLGVALVASVAGEDGEVEVTVDCAATAVANSAVVSATYDSIAVAFTLGTEENTVSFDGSKRDLGDDYGMLGHPYGSTLAEWYTQAQTFGNYVVGKTASGVAGITTDANGKTDLIAGCTIAVTAFMATTANAIANAR